MKTEEVYQILRWCDELEEDVAWVWCRNWRINAQSRAEWRKLIEEVSSHLER